MKHTTQNSPLSRTFETRQPRSTNHGSIAALKESTTPWKALPKFNQRIHDPKRFYGSYDASHGEGIKRLGYEVAERPKVDTSKIVFETVAGLQGSKTACALSESSTRRIRYEAVNPVTNEVEQRIAKLVTTKIAVLSYGKVFHFTKTNRGTSILDSRSDSRKSPQWVRSELRRLLGATEGDGKFAELTAA